MPSECGLTPALLAGIGDARIRQRMEACQQGILQLDSLRQKHNKLMEQLKAQYPDFASPSNRPATNNEVFPTPNYESTTLPGSHQNPQNSLLRCESPMSACMSHRSSVSIDSGYTSISSDPLLNMSSSPMSYSAYRKKASTLDRVPHSSTMVQNQKNEEKASELFQKDENSKILQQTIESTTGMRSNKYTRIQRKKEDSYQRPRSMYAVLPGSRNENEEKYSILPGSRNENEEKYSVLPGSRNENQGKFSIFPRSRSESEEKYPTLSGSQSVNEKKCSFLPRSRSENEKKYLSLPGSRNGNEEKNAVLPRSQNENQEKYPTLPGSRSENEEKCSSSFNKKDEEALAGVSVAATTRKLLDTSTFSQITPPLTSRKFATLEKLHPPKPLPRSIYPSSTTPPRALSASSSALHQPPPSVPVPPVPPVRSLSRPPPQFAKYETPVPLQNAKVYAPPRTLPPLPTSPNSAFTPTPPVKPRGNGFPQHQRAFIVPILPSNETFPSRHKVLETNNTHTTSNETFPSRQRIIETSNIHLAQPAAVLSRQQSSDSTAASPMEVRKLLLSTPHTVSRYGNSDQKKINSDKSPRRREKIWHESEKL
ncbi:hypothetical protein FO519_003459 [Halicephalobus sp. NKZ332]|nr:hypothetical protein FO519_003459 [Halicephalobus sp. NKZ332]